MKKLMILGVLMFALFACDKEDVDDVLNQPVELSYDFNSGADGWIGDFADYPVGEEESYALDYNATNLPAPLDEDNGALMVTGTNMSDDLFMYIKKMVDGLDSNTTYNVTFNVEFASNVPDDMAGVGGSPGESVWIKAGATTIEPVAEQDDMDYYRMIIDKGGQSQGGADMVVLGDFSNDTNMDEYTLKTVSNDTPVTVTTNSDGELWLIVGTDSGFEAATTIYYNAITVELDPLVED